MNIIPLVFIIVLISCFVETYSQEALVNQSKTKSVNEKKLQRKAKREFFNNFYNQQMYEELNRVLIKDTTVYVTYYIYDTSSNDYENDTHLTSSEKESIRIMAHALGNGKITFDIDSYIPKIEDENFMNEVKKILQKEQSLNLMIEGFTCNFDTDKYSRNLAVRRADTIKDLFVQKGANSLQIQTTGYTVNEAQSRLIFNNENSGYFNTVAFKIFRKL
jgi:outer membrane protein OmpA-like peptidoglycan-associated protein